MAVAVYLKFESDDGVLQLEGLPEAGNLLIAAAPEPPPDVDINALWYPSGVVGVGPGYDLSKVVSWSPAGPDRVAVRFEVAYQGDETHYFCVNQPVAFNRLAFERAMITRAPFTMDCHYELDGLADYIAFEPQSGLAADPLTLSMWLRTTTANGTLMVSPADPTQPSLRIQDGRLRFGHVGDDDLIGPEHAATMVNPGGLSDGNWHHVAMVRQATGEVQFYVDGVFYPVIDGTAVISFLGSTAGIWFGRSVSLEWYEGAVDELSWWTQSLDAAGVLELYNGGTPGDLRAHTSALFLLHWWQLGFFDELPAVVDRQVGADGVAYGITGASCV